MSYTTHIGPGNAMPGHERRVQNPARPAMVVDHTYVQQFQAEPSKQRDAVGMIPDVVNVRIDPHS